MPEINSMSNLEINKSPQQLSTPPDQQGNAIMVGGLTSNTTFATTSTAAMDTKETNTALAIEEQQQRQLTLSDCTTPKDSKPYQEQTLQPQHQQSKEHQQKQESKQQHEQQQQEQPHYTLQHQHTHYSQQQQKSMPSSESPSASLSSSTSSKHQFLFSMPININKITSSSNIQMGQNMERYPALPTTTSAAAVVTSYSFASLPPSSHCNYSMANTSTSSLYRMQSAQVRTYITNEGKKPGIS